MSHSLDTRVVKLVNLAQDVIVEGAGNQDLQLIGGYVHQEAQTTRQGTLNHLEAGGKQHLGDIRAGGLCLRKRVHADGLVHCEGEGGDIPKALLKASVTVFSVPGRYWKSVENSEMYES